VAIEACIPRRRNGIAWVTSGKWWAFGLLL
jgi:hypothetical protein